MLGSFLGGFGWLILLGRGGGVGLFKKSLMDHIL